MENSFREYTISRIIPNVPIIPFSKWGERINEWIQQ